ncbi:MAG: ATP-binding protein [Salinivirgaceae bacterium]
MIKKVIFQQKQERDNLIAQEYIPRLNNLSATNYLSTSLIKLITGPRRAGKSVLALQLLNKTNFAYLNFDDDLLLKNFDENSVVETLNEIYAGYEYLLLDEIQNLPNWELWVNKLYRRGVNLVITGSNAKLLSSEMATSLTGRYIQLAVFPFSFKEFINYFRVDHSQVELSPQAKGLVLNNLNNYITNGGFPEVVCNPSVLKNYLSSLFDSVLLKDIMKRFKIRQTQQLYQLANYLLANYCNLYSYNQLKADLNLSSVTTTQKFVGYLEEPYLFLNLTRYNKKIKLQQKSSKKTYIIDNGFIRARSFEISPNYGRLLENAIFIELLRLGYRTEQDIFYYRTRNDKEIDFICRKGHTVEHLIQVCYDISNVKTLKREIDALIEAALELNCSKLYLITWDRDETLVQHNCIIIIYPAWKWLLQIRG